MAASSLPSSSSLLRLPDELLLYILNHVHGLAHPWRSTSLYGLSLASRRLHGLTRPYLYSTFSFHAGVPYLFLRSICLNPDLASQVKVIRWDYDTTAAERFVYEPGVLAVKQQFHIDEVLDVVRQMATQGDPIAGQLIANLKLGRMYVGDQRALEVLLVFTPNVEHLEVAETFRWDEQIHWFLPILCSPNNYSRLTSATIQGPMRLQNVSRLMCIPTLRRLELRQVVETYVEYRTFSWDSSDSFIVCPALSSSPSSNLEHLHILDSYAKLGDIIELACITQNLKSFIYEHVRHKENERYLHMPYHNIARLLQHHRLSLTSIRISHEPTLFPYNEPDDNMLLDDDTLLDDNTLPDENILFKTIEDFPGLTDLELFLSFGQWRHRAPQWERIPPSLEQLTIDHHSARGYIEFDEGTLHLEQGLADLAVRKRRGELPKLRRLTFKDWHPFYGTFPQDMSIRNMLEDVGIQLSSLPAKVGSTIRLNEDIGWVELQSEPGWVIVERYRVDEE
jgi:hypothetical protein